MLKRSLPSPALVIACLALFVALGGTGYAATQLSQGEGQATASKKAKQGPRGPKGPKGAKGAKGATGATGATGANGLPGQRGVAGSAGSQGVPGERGPSDGAIVSVEGGNTEIGKSPAEPKVIASLPLTAGKWMVTGVAGLTNIASGGEERSAWCSLNVNGTQLGISQALDKAAPESRHGEATVLGAVDLAADSTVELRCWAEEEIGGVGDEVYTANKSRPSIQAIQVGTLRSE